MNRKERRSAKAQGIDIGQTDVRFGGRTVEVRVFVNTDEDEAVVGARVQAAAKGPQLRMAAALVSVLEAEQASAVWDTLVPQAISAAKSGGEA